VLADGIVLAAEEQPDAIVDIATLTGAALIALGTGYAGVLGSDRSLIDPVRAAADSADEPIWQLKNVAGRHGGTITAAVFLSEFTGDAPWAHLEIAPTMEVDADESWCSQAPRVRRSPADRSGDELHQGRLRDWRRLVRTTHEHRGIPQRGRQRR
jgi:leucyl aminopeptidase